MSDEAGSPLLLASLVLVVLALAFLVVGVFRDASTLLYLSIAASISAAASLIVAVAVRRRPRKKG